MYLGWLSFCSFGWLLWGACYSAAQQAQKSEFIAATGHSGILTIRAGEARELPRSGGLSLTDNSSEEWWNDWDQTSGILELSQGSCCLRQSPPTSQLTATKVDVSDQRAFPGHLFSHWILHLWNERESRGAKLLVQGHTARQDSKLWLLNLCIRTSQHSRQELLSLREESLWFMGSRENPGRTWGFWVPNFILELLHLWECPRYYPKAELWLGLASSAVLYMASWEGAMDKQNKIRQGKARQEAERQAESGVERRGKHE